MKSLQILSIIQLMLRSILILSIAFIVSIKCEVSTQIKNSKFKIAESADYLEFFRETSDLSVVIISCGGEYKLQLTIKSFFYFNTYPIKKMFIAHCSKDPIPMESLFPERYQLNKGYIQILQTSDEKSGIIEALEKIYLQINTTYVYQTDGQWITIKGFSYIPESINILKYAQQSNLKFAQVVPNYPYWRALARLSEMRWTSTQEAYHQIIPFAPQKFLYFTMSPSVFQFRTIFTQVLKNRIKDVCQRYQCKKSENSKVYEYDKCCIWAIGQQILKKQYKSIYINDGTGQANHQYLVL